MADVCLLYQRMPTVGGGLADLTALVGPLAYTQVRVHMQGLRGGSLFGRPNRWSSRGGSWQVWGCVVRGRFDGRGYGGVVDDSRVAVGQWTRSAMPSSGRRETKRVGDGSGVAVECSVSCFTPFSRSEAEGMYRQAQWSRIARVCVDKDRGGITNVDVDKDRLGWVASRDEETAWWREWSVQVELGGGPVGQERD